MNGLLQISHASFQYGLDEHSLHQTPELSDKGTYGRSHGGKKAYYDSLCFEYNCRKDIKLIAPVPSLESSRYELLPPLPVLLPSQNLQSLPRISFGPWLQGPKPLTSPFEAKLKRNG